MHESFLARMKKKWKKIYVRRQPNLYTPGVAAGGVVVLWSNSDAHGGVIIHTFPIERGHVPRSLIRRAVGILKEKDQDDAQLH
jgi:hypothetical protein